MNAAALHPTSASLPESWVGGVFRWLWLFAQGVGSGEGRKVKEASFEAVVSRHRGALERLCFYRERDAVKRQDLWQDMLLALWKSLGSLREEGSERAWVLRVAHNVAASHVARAMRERRHDDALGCDEAVDGPDRGAEAWELMRRVRLLDLASQQLVLLHVEGLTSQEIGEATGLSASNVTTRLSRIRKRLAEEDDG